MARASLADELLMSLLPPELRRRHGASSHSLRLFPFQRGMKIACERGCLVGIIADEGDGTLAPMIELDLSQAYVGVNSIGQLCVPMEMLDLQQLVDAALLRRRGRPAKRGPPSVEMLRQPVFSGICRCCGGRFFQPVFRQGRMTNLMLHTDLGWRES